MRIKNWKKVSMNCWQIRSAKFLKVHGHFKVCIRKGYSGDWLLASARKIVRRAKSKGGIYEKAFAWMRKHPNG